MTRVIVIGGGASGLMAAIIAARQGAKVTVLEHMDRIGRKLLQTGNGKCNFTNSDQDMSNYHGANNEFIAGILNKFDYNRTLEFFTDLGIIPKNKNGYIYPNSGQASTVLDLLRMELSIQGVEVICNSKIKNIEKKKKYFKVHTDTGIYESDSIILATGSKAAPATGSDGSGYNLAKEFGHKVSTVVPALVQLRCEGAFFKSIAGVRTDARVSIIIDDEEVASDTGELQLTDYGISGIPVFQVSRYASLALVKKKKVFANINFFPEYNQTDMSRLLKNRLCKNGKKTIQECLLGMLNKKLIDMIIKQANISFDRKSSDLTENDIYVLSKLMCQFQVEVIATNSFDKAQVCAGGVMTSDINPDSLESLNEDGIFFAGELIDVDAACGGYNLQWAWSSGYVAGYNAAMIKD